ncbi:4-hydroxythreonine-4-phosphate dehydrogenase PdxA [Candidatus Omnitrophota bacterium]
MNLKKKPISSSNKPFIGITLGDPSGIGPEVTAKALCAPEIRRLGRFFVIGDKPVLSQYFPKKISLPNVVIIDNNSTVRSFTRGSVNPHSGKAALGYINTALYLLKEKCIDALVTAPVSKESIKRAGLASFQGHTEYLAQKSKTKKVMMMLLSDTLRISLVTRHFPLSKVSKAVTKKKVYETLIQTHNCLKDYFRIKSPKIGVCALNPHAGEGGLLGNEEQETILPAIRLARRKNRSISDPLPADTLFCNARYKQFDAIVAMYHDQGMMPLKTIGFKNAVNLSYGLPFIRTSPAHGTGFDIAGKGVADPTSMIEAIKLACRLSRNSKKQ